MWHSPRTPVWYAVCVDLETVDRSADTFSDRMGKLADEYGLLERADDKRGYYRLTDKGLAYLHGELEMDDLESAE